MYSTSRSGPNRLFLEMPVEEAKLLEEAGAALLDFTNSGPVAGEAVVRAVSLPVIETTMPTMPARVNRTVGLGNHAGAPSRAMTAARNVTPQARSAASSQVCTV